MSEWLATLGSTSVPLFWEPVLGWTAVASVCLLGLSLFRSMHPLYGYRLRQALLFSLPISLLAAPFVGIGGGGSLIPRIPASFPGAIAASGITGRTVLEAAPQAADVGPLALGVILVIWSAATVGGLVLLGARLVDLGHLGESLPTCPDSEVLDLARGLQDDLGVARPVAIRVGPKGSVPMTFGWRRTVIAIPPELVGHRSRLEMALSHELIHVRRGDFVWGMLERMVQRTFALHPLAWVLGSSIDRFREASCDHEVVTSIGGDPRAYGELLLSLSTRPMPLLAAGMARNTSKLKRRIEIMTQFIDVPRSATRSARSGLAAALVAGLVGFGAACASSEAETPEPTAAELTSEFPSIVDGDPEAVLQRLEVQMDYLGERIAAMNDSLAAAQDPGSPRGRWEHLARRREVLDQMYFGRLEMLETLRLEVETERLINGLQ